MKELLHDDDVRRDAFAEGKAEGIAMGRVNTIQKMLAKGFALDVIQSLDFSEDEIREAQATMITT